MNNDPLDFELDFSGFAEDLEPAVIGPQDNRVQEIRTAQFPWNTVVHLCRDFGNGRCAGCSGTMIGPRQVLTAAHCLYSLKRHAAPQSIRVMPGRRDRRTLPYGSALAHHWYLPRAFVHGPDRILADWGIIVLREPITEIRRFLPLHAADDSELAWIARHGRITVAGYPSDRPVGTMWRHSEQLQRVTPRRLLYTVDTCPGHSGSGIWARTRGGCRIIGVHTAGVLDEQGRTYGCSREAILAPAGALNSGIRLTKEIVRTIRSPGAFRGTHLALIRFP